MTDEEERQVDLALVEAIEDVLRGEVARDDRRRRRANLDKTLWFTLGAASALVVAVVIEIVVRGLG